MYLEKFSIIFAKMYDYSYNGNFTARPYTFGVSPNLLSQERRDKAKAERC
jgi:hypothetical protein